ncbi:MAG: right-handed parallel beta-helix repeat-containing protein [Verrucomicrobiaceae bacterium]|nr:MAG: right-handed parallel beta-helix repeat-containing protein [Verrucomicrobiaceae bacterium]
MKRLLLFILLALPLPAAEWSYIGVPYVTDEVPTAIMPVLPTGADTVMFPDYDPCGIAAPVFADGANQYYVDTEDGVDVSAGNSGRGSVAAPRKTLPGFSGAAWTVTAGWQIFITENSTPVSSEFDFTLTSNGTGSSPVWIIGMGTKPTFWAGTVNVYGDHLFLHNLRFKPLTDALKMSVGGDGAADADNITIRYCEFDGNFLGNTNGRFIRIRGKSDETTSAIVLYRNSIHSFSQWYVQDGTGDDNHGVQPELYTSHIWIVENNIYHCKGDSIQVGNSGYNDGVYHKRPHYVYIAGNTFHSNYEQGVDCKNSYHVVISRNDFSNFYPKPGKASNGLAILLVNNAEGWLGSYHWAIANTIYDSATGIKASNTSAEVLSEDIPPVQVTGSKSYIISNVMWDLTKYGIQLEAQDNGPDGTNPPVRVWGTENWIVNNTISSAENPIRQLTASASGARPATYTITGNLLENLGVLAEVAVTQTSANTHLLTGNWAYRPGGSVSIASGDFDTYTGNTLDTLPGVVGPTASDFRLSASSPAINTGGALPACYTTFETLYGISIAVDMEGAARPQGAAMDPGAYEWTAGQRGLRYRGNLLLTGDGATLGTAGAGVGVSLED